MIFKKNHVYLYKTYYYDDNYKTGLLTDKNYLNILKLIIMVCIVIQSTSKFQLSKIKNSII